MPTGKLRACVANACPGDFTDLGLVGMRTDPGGNGSDSQWQHGGPQPPGTPVSGEVYAVHTQKSRRAHVYM